MSSPLVTVITATTGNPLLTRCWESVCEQTYKNVQHLVVVDGPDRLQAAQEAIAKIQDRYRGFPLRNVCALPYATGKNRYNGHRIYGAFTFIADGDYIIYLDDDNFLEPNHIESLVRTVKEKNLDWAYSFRSIWDQNGKVCNDDCESLGKWPSVLGPTDYFVDVNCYFLSKKAAVAIAPVWYKKFREPGEPEIDRILFHVLNQHFPNYDSSYQYSVCYQVGNTPLSVQKEFFIQGNARMRNIHGDNLPWKP